MLQVKRGQGGVDEPGGQSATPAGLTEVLPHPVKQPGVGVIGPRRLVEVDDVGPENTSSTSLTECKEGAVGGFTLHLPVLFHRSDIH